MTKERPTPLPDVGDIIFLLVLQLALILLPNMLLQDGSTAWHLVAGDYILQHGKVPRTDLISYTHSQQSWVAYEWLADVIFAGLVRIGGVMTLAAFCASLIALVFLLVYESCRKSGGHFLLALFLTVVGCIAASVHWLARPHLFTFLGVYVYTRVLRAHENGTMSGALMVALLAATMLFWVNLHPAFLMGFAIGLIYLVAEALSALITAGDARAGSIRRLKWLCAALAAMFAASLVNPYEYHLYRYIGHYLKGTVVLDATDEYLSPVFHGALQPLCLEILLLFLALGLVLCTVRPRLSQVLVSLAFAHLALSAQRNAPLFAVVSIPFICELFASASLLPLISNASSEARSPFWCRLTTAWQRLGASFDQTERVSQMHILPVLAVAVLFLASINGGKLMGNQLLLSEWDPKRLPDKTLRYIQEHKLAPESGFNYDNWGGYIRYKLGIPVFIDDRADFYGQEFYTKYATIFQTLPGWRQLLDDLKINWVLIPTNSRLALTLKDQSNWNMVESDQAAVLFERRQP